MNAEPRASGARCPICGKPMIHRWRPFCSARCRQIDLGRWLKESYRIETEDGPDESDRRLPDEPTDQD